MIASPARFSPPFAASQFSPGFAQRLTLFAVLFAAEWIPLSGRGHGLASLVQVTVVIGTFFIGLLYARARNSLDRVADELHGAPIGRAFLASHFGALLVTVWLSGSPGSAIMTCAAGAAAIGLAFCAFVPPKISRVLVQKTGYAWAYASVIGLLAWRLTRTLAVGNQLVWNPFIDLSWKPATDLTFGAVQALLRLFLPQVVADRATMTIGSPTFNVTILPGCAGLEGTALITVFSVAWLWFFRKEFRFPAALLLIPAAMAGMWISNAIRITALVLIGVAGAPDVAVGGFHTQAGWIAFNCVALSLALLSLRLPWFTKSRTAEAAGYNATIACLMPVCAILAAAMVSRAAAGDFEWLYPLRFVAAAAALLWFRAQYAQLDWRVGWFSVAAGGAVFAMWLGFDRLTNAPADNSFTVGIAQMSGPAGIAWLAVRIFAAVVTVPIAEELAFRCFLIRRVMSHDFESLGPRQFSVVAVLISSLAFGLLHGDRWLAGLGAGLIYAFVFLRRGSTGDAVIAHATTNALLAAWVLAGGRWFLW